MERTDHEANRMESVEVDTFTTYEVAGDGSGVRLNFQDNRGCETAVSIPMEALKTLTLSLPKIMLEVLQVHMKDPTLRLVHAVDTWRVERASDGQTCILTFVTPDQFSISFNVNDAALAELSEAVIEHELEAFPQGLHFH
jgi:hypothetical protein